MVFLKKIAASPNDQLGYHKFDTSRSKLRALATLVPEVLRSWGSLPADLVIWNCLPPSTSRTRFFRRKTTILGTECLSPLKFPSIPPVLLFLKRFTFALKGRMILLEPCKATRISRLCWASKHSEPFLVH